MLNARTLERELDWFCRVLDARLRLYFGEECPWRDIAEIDPPDVSASPSAYGRFINHYQLTFEERLVFVLALVPHLKPHVLDAFFVRKASDSRYFTEFGGRNGNPHGGFMPTGETALFLVGGTEVGRRLAQSHLFDDDHFFIRHRILSLEGKSEYEPALSGVLTLSAEVLNLVTTGSLRVHTFAGDFPARLMETEVKWEELILDRHTMDQVMEIKAWIEWGPVLLGELGLGRTLKPGYRALFHGPPGTGKTLTAALLGRVTGRPVYRIDLATVISKYIGETEKNLEKVFSRAEDRDWILFFDEADALFGKRTAVSDAHDRFANQEVSYLLQRVEDYGGVVILASNQRSNMDDAFLRRFQSVIHFPMPREEDRRRLWKGAFSSKTPLEESVDLRALAAQYEISGGAIMNVVRYTTLMALRRGDRSILLQDLLEGIRRELQKEGRTA